MFQWSSRSERNRHPHCYGMCRTRPVTRHVHHLQQPKQFVCGQPSVPEDRPQRAFGDLLVVRNCHAAERLSSLPEHDVAPLLPVDHIARLLERSDEIAPGDDRKPSQSLNLDNLFGYRRRHWVAMGLQALQIEGDGFTYVR
jgi:hypothetical protein